MKQTVGNLKSYSPLYYSLILFQRTFLNIAWQQIIFCLEKVQFYKVELLLLLSFLGTEMLPKFSVIHTLLFFCLFLRELCE